MGKTLIHTHAHINVKVKHTDCGPPVWTLNAIHPVGSVTNAHVADDKSGESLCFCGISKATLAMTVLDFPHHAHLIWISTFPPTQEKIRSSWELLEILIAVSFESLSYCELLKLSRLRS